MTNRYLFIICYRRISLFWKSQNALIWVLIKLQFLWTAVRQSYWMSCCLLEADEMSRHMIKPTKWLRSQRRLRSAWASAQFDQSSLCTQWVAKDQAFFMWTMKTDQTGWMPRLIWVFAGCTCHFVGFVMRWLKFIVKFNKFCGVWSLRFGRWKEKLDI